MNVLATVRRHIGLQRLLSFLKRVVSSRIVLSLALGIAVWEVVGRLANPLFFASFSQVAKALWEIIITGEIWLHTGITLFELFLGFCIGSIIGLVGGVLAALNRTFGDLTDPWVSFLYSTPYVAFIPLLIVWLGIGLAPKVVIAVLAIFIPVWLNTSAGIMNAEPQYVEVARAFNATRLQIVTLVLLRNALPVILVGLRLALARGLIAVVVGEFVGATAGLGFLIHRAGSFFDAPRLLAGVVVLGGFTVLATELLKWIERRLVPWGLRV